MRIALLGATGGTGLSFLEQALGNGHTIKALARTPENLTINHPNLVIQAGNVFTVSSLTSLMQDTDVVVSVFGISGIWQARKPRGLYSIGGTNVIKAMQETGHKRLLAVTSSGVEPQPNDGFFFKYIFKPLFLEKMYEDMRILEKNILTSNLDYTIVRPPYLTDGPLTGQYRISATGNFADDKDLSRADLAHFLLHETEQSGYIRKTVALSY
ncbi:hypothetical protein BN8_04141 [Fibrisoma limi BUZ 3]|uniref:NAD(P)-binding domain-containing protein n=1 Tax=Fibrisoma limi BUZ 3 TaxID=1185876 RepID=I2GLZ6_9BACT|nr:NAD(P)H-binding protein [Fibrisoma limi]CCH54922.1 hypothetical protein BN8_04141 [Fibrisoma limi BUZ 3]